jgi:hypothetical protein
MDGGTMPGTSSSVEQQVALRKRIQGGTKREKVAPRFTAKNPASIQ